MAIRRMRIMLVVNEYPPQKIAGTAMATQALAQVLSRRGHAVHVVVTTPCRSDARDGVCVSSMPDRPFRGVGIFWRLWHVWRIARKWQPDVLQGQAVSCGLLTAVVGRVLGRPNIAYVQGQDVYQSSILQRLTEIRLACRISTVVAAVTRQLADRLVSIKACEDVHVIPHGFSKVQALLSRQDWRRSQGFATGQKVVLSVGRLERIKGQDILLSAWVEVQKKCPDAILYLVGDGSMRESLEQQAADLNLSTSVRFPGAAVAAEVAAYMSSADVFVLPSRSEAFGIVLLEAMACALPVVATEVGGVPEVLPEGEAVSLVSGENAGELAVAIVHQLQHACYPSEVNKKWAMGFVWEENVLHFEEAYRQVLQ
ncbi:MAG: glycosyltransferase [Mariprofundaceae bacterium]